MKTDDAVLTTRDDVEMIKRTHLWPQFPKTLALKHRRLKDGRGIPKLGFLIRMDGEPDFRVRLGTIFDRSYYDLLPYEQHDSAEAIVAAGWMVD